MLRPTTTPQTSRGPSTAATTSAPATLRLAAAALVASAAALTLLPPSPPAALAHIPLDSSPLFSAPQENLRRRQREDLVRLFEGSPLQQKVRRETEGVRRPTPAASATAPTTTAERAKDALAALKAGDAAVDAGDYETAAREYGRVVEQYGDLALSEYARFGAALVAYQRAGEGGGGGGGGGNGNSSASLAIAGLEDSALALTGRAEAHAALAAVLYAERPAQLSRAELEFEVATEFDRRYSDAEWVAKERHWPPRAVEALRRFLALA